MNYYDTILTVIGMSLLGGVLVGVLTSVTVQTGIVAGSAVATIFVSHAIFARPPTPVHDPRTAYAAAVWLCYLVVLLLAYD